MVENFDYCTATFVLEDNKKLLFTEDDVFATYNISRGKKAVVEAKTDNDLPEFAELFKSWRERKNIPFGSPITQRMGEEIILEETMVMSLRGTLWFL